MSQARTSGTLTTTDKLVVRNIYVEFTVRRYQWFKCMACRALRFCLAHSGMHYDASVQYPLLENADEVSSE